MRFTGGDADKMRHKSLYLRKQTSNNCTFIYLPRGIVKQWLIYAQRHLAITGIITDPVPSRGWFTKNSPNSLISQCYSVYRHQS